MQGGRYNAAQRMGMSVFGGLSPAPRASWGARGVSAGARAPEQGASLLLALVRVDGLAARAGCGAAALPAAPAGDGRLVVRLVVLLRKM
jgi:hypothetical protein